MPRTILWIFAALGITLSGSMPVAAQEVQQSTAIVNRDVMNQISAFSYREGPESELLLTGTPLAPAATGKVEVEFQNGRSEVRSDVKDLPEPAALGPFTTYILWAITPDGRATNLGAIETPGGKGKLNTSFSGSQFALLVAAEPHFAVRAPSSYIVLFNLAKEVKGEETKITSLAERADYSNLAKIASDEKSIAAGLVGARYAVAIAAAAGAGQYAASELAAAQAKLDAAEAAQASKKSSERKQAPPLAREATQAGEEASRAAMAGKAAADEQARKAAAAAEAGDAQRARSEQMAAEEARNDLRNRLNAVLPTRETERGLVSEIGGVQFATGTANLNSAARESLANFAGVVVSYPQLRYNVEGHTDNTGSAAKNEELSLKRAIAVRDYLIAKGVAASATDVAGLGASTPIADNATADGRARNRRVEIVVSGGPLAK